MRLFQVARVFIVGFPTQQHNKIAAFLYTSQAVSQNPKQREVKVFEGEGLGLCKVGWILFMQMY